MKKSMIIAMVIAVFFSFLPMARAEYSVFTNNWATVDRFPSHMPLYEGNFERGEHLRADAAKRFIDRFAMIQMLWFDIMNQTKQLEQRGMEEWNPLLTKHPSDMRLNAYFTSCIITFDIVANALPEPKRGVQWSTSFVKSVYFTEELVTDRNAALFRGESEQSSWIVPAIGFIIEVKF